MKCLICLFSLSTHLKCHIRPNTGFPLAGLINFATVKLAAANESDSDEAAELKAANNSRG